MFERLRELESFREYEAKVKAEADAAAKAEAKAAVAQAAAMTAEARVPGRDIRAALPGAEASDKLSRPSAEVTRQVLDAVDEAGQQVVRLPGGADVRHAGQQLAQDSGDLPARQVGPEAEVRPR